ncbi:MAG TPA: hypothetical protein VGM64_19490 [Lacunisphaera sp.]|jgi:hypothetical protein
MQISSSHAGFNYQSVYKSVVTRQLVPAENGLSSADPKASAATDEKADQMNRDTLMLKAAQKSADHTACQCESIPDL